MSKVLFIFGTRPEAIKMAPLVIEFKKKSDLFITEVCVTAQHREMLDQVINFFHIKPDYDLNLMKPRQNLFDVTANGIKGIEGVVNSSKPDLIFVQGDTTTVLIGALAGYYNKIKVAHLEAGLRSGNKLSPFPEEMNRILTGHLSDYHFAPTNKAKENLFNEGIKENVWVVGNTVIDAMLLALEIIKDRNIEGNIIKFYNEIISGFDNLISDSNNKRIILVTGHRRESFGKPFENICFALKDVVEKYEDVEIIYPVHLNPNVREPVNRILNNQKRIHLIEPLDYSSLIWLLNRSFLVLTDSGGIQEEAPSLAKPVLVMRDVTERIEGIESGTAILVGTDRKRIFNAADRLLSDEDEYRRMAKAVNPYGNGDTSKKIVNILAQHNVN